VDASFCPRFFNLQHVPESCGYGLLVFAWFVCLWDARPSAAIGEKNSWISKSM
jgi:hypothetical protein